MSARALLAALLIAGCTPSEKGTMGTMISDATQAIVDGVEIGVGNFARRDYTRSDGTTARGLTVTLFPANGAPVIVGEGDVATVSGHRFVVQKIEVPLVGKAYVELGPAPRRVPND